MSRTSIKKLIIYNGIILAVNIVLFSNAFLKVRIFGDSTLETIIGIAVILGSVFFFFYINLRLFGPRSPKIDPARTLDKLSSLESCHDTIVHLDYSGTFSPKLKDVLEQIQKMQKKKALIKDILLQKFSDGEMSYDKFFSSVTSAEQIMVLNIKSMLNKICAFDDEEYTEIKEGRSSLRQSIATQKMDIYNEYIEFVDLAVEGNEEILLRLDKLLLEISNFNSVSISELESMPALRELDTLIQDSKWYR